MTRTAVQRPIETRYGLALAAALALVACGSEPSSEPISPQPQPVLGIVIEPTRISISDLAGEVAIAGEPGTLGALPGTATITNASLPDVSASIAFPKDGSFELTLAGEPTHHFKLYAVNDDNQNGTLDFTADPKTGQTVTVSNSP